MPRLKNHGGNCCGINHIVEFGSYPEKTYLDSLDHCIKNRKPVRQKGLLEVVLTDSQMVCRNKSGLTWHEALLDRGFVRVGRFYNSGNSYCNVYHFIHGQNNLIGEKNDPILKLEKDKAENKIEKKVAVSSPFSSKTKDERPIRQQGRDEPLILNISPRALREARERGINLNNVVGTGPNGRILSRDIPNA